MLVALGHPLYRLVFEVEGVLMLAGGMLAFAARWELHRAVIAVVLAEAAMAATGWWMVRERLHSARPVS